MLKPTRQRKGRTVACPEKLGWVGGGGWGGWGEAQSNFPTHDHQNIFNLILTYFFFGGWGGGGGGHGLSGPYECYGYERYYIEIILFNIQLMYHLKIVHVKNKINK